MATKTAGDSPKGVSIDDEKEPVDLEEDLALELEAEETDQLLVDVSNDDKKSARPELSRQADGETGAEDLPPVPAGRVRLEAVHVYGVDDMSTDDVLDLFSLYTPSRVEWINDKSCNVVWEELELARRALIGVGHHPLSSTLEVTDKQREEEKEESRQKDGEEETEDLLRWRCLADSHPKAEQLLVRHATTGDMKLPGSARRSQYYRKYGNPNHTPSDLRGKIVRKKRLRSSDDRGDEEEEKEEGEMDLEDDPLSLLAKRPRPMHSDRTEDEGDSERDDENGRAQVVTRERREEEGGVDLRGVLKRKRKRRELQMRLGTHPRLVEEHH